MQLQLVDEPLPEVLLHCVRPARDVDVPVPGGGLRLVEGAVDAVGDEGEGGAALRSKTGLTDVGLVEIDVPRDRAGSFEPQIVKKRQRRLTGVDEMVLSLSARGLTHGEISAHLREVYGAEVRSP